ncbi:hypothetical protein ACWFNE_20395 [Cellulomonas sp. NPDC055163]
MSRTWVAALGVGVLLAGCATSAPAGQDGTPGATSAPPTSSASSSGAPTPTPMEVPPGTVEYHDGSPVPPGEPDPVWDEASRVAAVAAATGAVAAFARPGLPYEQWWAELAPALSVQAQMDYQYVDPANVPARAVTGPAVLVDEASASVAGVQVPTDVGPYTVVLSRASAGQGWLVERITPPEGLG